MFMFSKEHLVLQWKQEHLTKSHNQQHNIWLVIYKYLVQNIQNVFYIIYFSLIYHNPTTTGFQCLQIKKMKQGKTGQKHNETEFKYIEKAKDMKMEMYNVYEVKVQKLLGPHRSWHLSADPSAGSASWSSLWNLYVHDVSVGEPCRALIQHVNHLSVWKRGLCGLLPLSAFNWIFISILSL